MSQDNTNKPHLLSAGYIDDQETYDSPYFFPAEIKKEEQQKVFCGVCKKPIHADNFGEIKKGDEKKSLFYHRKCLEKANENVLGHGQL